MSGLALVCRPARRRGHRLATAPSRSYLSACATAGLEPRVGHDADAVPPDAEVVVSTAIGEDNPELARARERGQRVIHRGELLAELCAERAPDRRRRHPREDDDRRDARPRPARAGADPAFLLGGELPGAGPGGAAANAGWGEGEWIVAEADESDAQLPRAAPRGRGRHQRRARPPLALGARAPSCIDAFARFAAPAHGAGAAAPAPDASTGARPAPRTRVARFDARRRPGPAARRCAVPGRHNLLNARARARRASSSPGSTLEPAAARARRLPGDAAPARAQGRRATAPRLRRLRPPPDRGRGGARGAARARARGA